MANTPLAKGQTRPGLHLRVNLHGLSNSPFLEPLEVVAKNRRGENPSLCLSFFPLGPDFVFSSVLLLPGGHPAPAAEGVRRGSWAKGGTKSGALHRVPQSRRRAPKAGMQPQPLPKTASLEAGGQVRRRRSRAPGGEAAALVRGSPGAAPLRSPAWRRRLHPRDLVSTRARARPLRLLSLARAQSRKFTHARRSLSRSICTALHRPAKSRAAGVAWQGCVCVCARAGWGWGEPLNLAGAATCFRGGLLPFFSVGKYLYCDNTQSPKRKSNGHSKIPWGSSNRTDGQSHPCTEMRTECSRAEKGWWGAGRGLEGRRSGEGSREGGWERARDVGRWGRGGGEGRAELGGARREGRRTV